MPVTYSDFMTFADKLSDSEIDLRNAASRSYYAAYHRCLLAYQKNRTGEQRFGGSHKQLSDSLIHSPAFDDKKIGYKLQQAHKLRCQADYYLKEIFEKNDKRQAVEIAKKIIASVDEAFPEAS